MRWRRGEIVLLRHLHRGRVVQAVPTRVAADEPDVLATWIAPGTPLVYPAGLDGQGRLLPLERWGLVERTWFGTGSLDLTPPARAYALRLFWNDDGSFRGWYVNLQEQI